VPRARAAARGSLALYLHAFLANLVSAGVRLVPLGQSAGQRVVAALEAGIVAAATDAASATLSDLGTACPAAEIFSMQHETQYTRLFRS
jgi:urease accessory protein